MKLILGLIAMFCFFTLGLSIDCYRCNSSSTLDCLEKFMQPNPLKPESCADVFEARYCIKTTGIYKGVIGSQRFCSERDMGNYCDFITHQDQREYKGCVYTCYSDGCNAATSNFHVPLIQNIIALTGLFVFTSKLILCST